MNQRNRNVSARRDAAGVFSLVALLCMLLLVPGYAAALTITDAGAWVPGKVDRQESLSGAGYKTAELESEDGRFLAQAESLLGYNRVRASMYNNDPFFSTDGWADTKSYWRDTLTISMPAGTCTDGQCVIQAGVYLFFTLFDSEASWFWFDLQTEKGSGLRINHDDNGVCYGNAGACSYGGLMLFDLAFDDGEPFDVWAGMYGGVQARYGDRLGYVEAFNSAAFAYLDLPPGATVSSASGTVYPVPYTPVPLPAAAPLLVSALSLCAVVRRRTGAHRRAR